MKAVIATTEETKKRPTHIARSRGKELAAVIRQSSSCPEKSKRGRGTYEQKLGFPGRQARGGGCPA